MLVERVGMVVGVHYNLKMLKFERESYALKTDTPRFVGLFFLVIFN